MQTAGTSYSVRDQSRDRPQRTRQSDQPWRGHGSRRCKAMRIGKVTMSKVDLRSVRNNRDLPAAFQEHLLRRIDEQNEQYRLV